MACHFYKTRHICSSVSVHCHLDVRLLQRRPSPHFQKCAIATRKNGDIFNPAVPDQVKPVLKVARLSGNATIPTKASANAAGYDLYSAYDYSIAPMEKAVVNTDIQIAVPPGCYGRLAPRSGLAVNHFIDVGAGVVDEDYRGNVGVVLFNFGKETFQVRKGERIAQLICERICHPDLEQCEALDETERGTDGFGSTGRS
ncbi:deoxyuridine 5'-triphosphate nucleotidohydrolase, mitochondrial [Brienomyrus brachyistius]|uniref:deoxyuridine 5'-triphosphate nucleotidohydrolase, mitochondrial n=1 Tax=Brienomyrus brachyistius TaxID=42636 RepID=UPI0020B31DD5|nr:deoxyuridine 5'-triphosphate nucleotidohydrolase, mitochondrial [Brienomyrus brachyistius]